MPRPYVSCRYERGVCAPVGAGKCDKIEGPRIYLLALLLPLEKRVLIGRIGRDSKNPPGVTDG